MQYRNQSWGGMIIISFFTTMEIEFKVRAYGRTELAQLYSPHISSRAAHIKFKKWINLYPGLADQLRKMGFKETSHQFTPAQVRLIVESLGEP